MRVKPPESIGSWEAIGLFQFFVALAGMSLGFNEVFSFVLGVAACAGAFTLSPFLRFAYRRRLFLSLMSVGIFGLFGSLYFVSESTSKLFVLVVLIVVAMPLAILLHIWRANDLRQLMADFESNPE